MITFNKEKNTFHLKTPSSSYCIFITERGYIAHAYYGGKIADDDITYLTRHKEYGFADFEAVSVNISRTKKAGSYNMMAAQNPVTVFVMQKGRING